MMQNDLMPLHHDVMTYVFRFMTASVIPQTTLGSKRIAFRQDDAAKYDARVDLIANPGRPARFDIVVNTGVADAIMGLLRQIAGQRRCAQYLGLRALRNVGIPDIDAMMNVVFCHAVSFACLHELAHVAAGHVECWVEHFKKQRSANFNETTRFAMASNPAASTPRATLLDGLTFNKMSELEADGTACELQHEFHRDIAAMVSTDPRARARLRAGKFSKPQDLALRRLALLGQLTAISLLQRSWRDHDPAVAGYPFPQARLLNAVSALIRRSIPQAIRFRDGETIVHVDNDDLAGVVDALARNVMMPVFWLLNEGAESDGIDSLFFAKTAQSADEIIAPLLWDISSLLTDEGPRNSVGGRELAELERSKPIFYAMLDGFRSVGWWRRDDAPTPATGPSRPESRRARRAFSRNRR